MIENAATPTPIFGNVLLTVPEVAIELRISKTAAYRLCQSGELPALRFGKGNIRVRDIDLRAYIENQLSHGEL